MSDPGPLKPKAHHGVRKWTATWRDGGKTHAARFGTVGVVGRAEATNRYRVWLAARAEAAARAAARPTYSVGDLCDDFFADVRTRYVQPDGRHSASVARYAIALESFGTRLKGREADSVTPGDVHGWSVGFITEQRGEKARKHPRTAHTVNQAISCVRAMYEWGAVRGKVSAGTANAVTLVRNVRADHSSLRRKARIGSVTLADVEATCAKLVPALADLVWFCWHTGCRPGEACALTWAEIDRSGKVWVYSPVHHKTAWRGKARRVAIGPKAQEVLGRHVSTRIAGRAFRDEGGRGFSTGQVRLRIATAAGRAGVPAWNPNQLRHAFATRVRLLMGAEAVQAVLGHASVSEQEAYVDRTVAMAAKVAQEVG